MISRGLLWFIGLAVLALLVVAWWGSSYPAHLVVINQAGTLRDVTVTSAGRQIVIGEMRRGESRSVKLPSGHSVTVEFRSSRPRRWTSTEKTSPAQSIVINISPEERVSMRSGLAGTR